MSTRTLLAAGILLGVAGAIALGLLAKVAYDTYSDDPVRKLYERPFPEGMAADVVAAKLCPQHPETWRDSIVVTFDSGYYRVYAGPAVFIVVEDQDGTLRVEPLTDRSSEYLVREQAGCSR